MNTIYKFQSFNLNSFSSLINSELWFSSPNDFNDPLDCKINLKITEYPDKINAESFYRNMHEVLPNETTFQDKLNKYQNDPSVFEADYKAYFDLRTNRSIIITCFSKRYSHPLMWAHYAESHSGLCLGFDRTLLQNRFGKESILDVEYPPRRSPIKIYANPEHDKPINFDTRSAFKTKYHFWVYEEEVRIVLINDRKKKIN